MKVGRWKWTIIHSEILKKNFLPNKSKNTRKIVALCYSFDASGESSQQFLLLLEGSIASGRGAKSNRGHYSNLSRGGTDVVLDKLEPYKDILFAKHSSNITRAPKCSIYMKIIESAKGIGITLDEHSVPYFGDRVQR